MKPTKKPVKKPVVKKPTRKTSKKPVKTAKKPAKKVRQIARLEDMTNVGIFVAAELRQLGITSTDDLPVRDPYALYDELCRITGHHHDPCLLDTFIAAVRYMEGAPKKPWWAYTAERKRAMAARREASR